MHHYKGSEWNKWDLHIHTPESGMANQFGNDWDKYVLSLFKSVIANNIATVKKYGNAITSTACYETIMISEDGIEIDSVPPRKDTYSAQAPQSFYLKDIIAAHDVVRATPTGYEGMVDACTIIRSQNIVAHIVEGNRGNIKVTTPEDVYMFRALLQYKENEQAFGLGITNKIDTRMSQYKKDNEK